MLHTKTCQESPDLTYLSETPPRPQEGLARETSCAQVALSPFLLSHVHCFVSALRRSYVVSVSRCSCSLMCLALSSSASRCSLMCFALSQHHVAHNYAMPCLVSACYHTITPLFSALPFSGYSIMTIHIMSIDC